MTSATFTAGLRKPAALGALLAFALLGAGGAHALTVDFLGPDDSGFDNSENLEPDLVIPSAEDWLTAGSEDLPGSGDFDIVLDETLQRCLGLEDSDPCDDVPTGDGAFHVNITWTFTANIDVNMPVAVFISGLNDDPDYSLHRDDIFLEIPDEEDVVILQYSVGGVDYFYAGVLVDPEDFQNGNSVQLRLLVNAPLDPRGTPGLLANAFVVPEPSSALLFACGLAGLLTVSRRRCA